MRADVRRAASLAPSVDVVRVHRAAAESILTLPGEARSFSETTLYARTSGYLSKWFVDIGDHVKDGQTLATIETPELDDQLVAARAKVDQLKADAHVAETTSQFAKVSFDRWESAAPGGAVSQQERDQKKAELDSAVAKLQSANAQVALGDADVKRLLTLTGFKKVVAPFDGVITQRHIDIGTLVTAGSTTNTTPLFTVSQSDRILVFVDVPQAAIGDIKVGMPVRAAASEQPGQVFHGKVDRTAGAVDPASRTMKVQVLVPNPDLRLLPGMFLRVTFESSRPAPPIKIPSSAMTFRPDGPAVAVIGATGRVAFHPVTILRDLGDFIEIGSGVEDNDRVALNIGNTIVEGSTVDAHDADTPIPATPAPGAGPTTRTAATPVPITSLSLGAAAPERAVSR